jgi:hypothetical protein
VSRRRSSVAETDRHSSGDSNKAAGEENVVNVESASGEDKIIRIPSRGGTSGKLVLSSELVWLLPQCPRAQTVLCLLTLRQ